MLYITKENVFFFLTYFKINLQWQDYSSSLRLEARVVIYSFSLKEGTLDSKGFL